MKGEPARNVAVGLDKAAARLATVGAVVAACFLVFMTLHVVLEVALRGIFSTSTFALDEYVGYGTASVTFLAAGYALQEGALIRVNIILGRLRPAGLARRAIEVFSGIMTIAIMALLHWYFLISVFRNYNRGAVSETVAATPLWIPEAIVTAGITILLLRLSAYLLLIVAGGPVFESNAEDIDSATDTENALSMGSRK